MGKALLQALVIMQACLTTPHRRMSPHVQVVPPRGPRPLAAQKKMYSSIEAMLEESETPILVDFFATCEATGRS